MEKHELEALADAMLAEHRTTAPAAASSPPPPPEPVTAPAPTDDIAAWADAVLEQHRTVVVPKKRLWRR
jgi:hypothetical protein